MISKRKKQLFISIFILFISSVFLYNFFMSIYIEDIKKKFLNKQIELYSKKNDDFNKKIELIKKDYFIFYENKNFKNFVKNRNNKNSVEDLFLFFIKKSPYISQFRFIDTKGNEILRVQRDENKTYIVNENKLQNKSHRYYFQEAIKLRKNQFWYSNLDLNIENNTIQVPYIPTLRVAIPIYYENKKYGILISNINMKNFLNDFVSNTNFDIFIVDNENNILFSNFNEINWSKYLKKDIDFNDYIKKQTLQSKKTLRLNNNENLELIIQIKQNIYEKLIQSKRQTLILYLVIFNLILFYIIQLIYTKKRLNERIEKQIMQIKKNISILDKYVIFSKTNSEGIIIEVSSAYEKISGYTKKELIGRPHSITRHPDMPKTTFDELWKKITSGNTWIGEIKNKRKDGTSYWTLSTITPEFDKHNRIKSYISIKHDITDKKILQTTQDKLIEKEKMASLGSMIGNIAHQWRQPLSIISTSATGMKLQEEMGTLTKEILIEHAENINKNAQYLSETINTFKNYLKNKKTLEKISVQSVLKETLDLVDASLKNNYIDLKVNIDKNEPIEINVVKGELIESIMNLIVNAKDALVEKKIQNPWIEIELQSTDYKVIITIEDNAGGIPDDIKHKIFEPYFTTKHESQGTGLGLYIVYKIITERFKGNINILNTENGAKFFIDIPFE